MSSDTASIDVPLPDDGTYRYGYRQSIYGVAVVETERAAPDRLMVVRVRSTDRRSLEYYRWGDDTIVPDAGGFVQNAPPVAMPAPLQIRITDDGQQWIEAEAVRVDLLARFGPNIVRVTPSSAPTLSWLLAHLTRP